MLQPLTTRLIDTCPWSIYALWALGDAMGASSPELTYTEYDPDNLPGNIAITQVGSPEYQKPEIYAGFGDMTGTPNTGDGWNITMDTNLVILYHSYFPTRLEDSTVYEGFWGADDSSSASAGFGYNLGRINGAKLLNDTYLTSPPGNSVACAVRRDPDSTVYHQFYFGSTYNVHAQYASPSNLYKLKNVGLWVNNLMIIDPAGASMPEVIAWYQAQVSRHRITGAPYPGGVALYNSPDLLYSSQIDSPPKPRKLRWGRYHTAFQPNQAVVVQPDNSDAPCQEAKFKIVDYTPPVALQDGEIQVNTDTIIDFQYDPAASTIKVGGDTCNVGGVLNLDLIMKLIDNAGTWELRISVIDDEVHRQDTTFALTTAASHIDKISITTGELKIRDATLLSLFTNKAQYLGSVGTYYPVTKVSGTSELTQYQTNVTPYDYLADCVTCSRIVGYTYEWGVLSANLAAIHEITTGDFCVAVELYTRCVTDKTADGIRILEFGSTEDGATPIKLFMRTNGDFTLKGVGADVVINKNMTELNDTYMVTLQRVGTTFDLFINGVSEHQDATFNGDVGYVNTHGKLLVAFGEANMSIATARMFAVFSHGLPASEHMTMAEAAVGTAPLVSSSKVVGLFAGATDGIALLIRRDTGEVIATAAVDAFSWYVLSNIPTLEDAVLVVINLAGDKRAACTLSINGPEALPAPIHPDNGQAGAKSLTGTCTWSGVPKGGDVYVYRRSDMTLLIHHLAYGGTYTLHTDEVTECVVVTIVGSRATLRFQTPV